VGTILKTIYLEIADKTRQYTLLVTGTNSDQTKKNSKKMFSQRMLVINKFQMTSGDLKGQQDGFMDVHT
jgi:hypothetical protein